MARRRRLPNFLRAAEKDALLAAAQAEIAAAPTPARRRSAERDWLFAAAGLFLGLRVSEISKLQIEQLDFTTRQVFVCQGKGDKDRYVPLHGRLIEPLRQWIGARASGPVFPSGSS